MNKYAFLLAVLIGNAAWAVSLQEVFQGYETSSGKASSQRREQFFNSKNGHGWNCASCHASMPYKGARHIVTVKSIEPLASSANPKCFNGHARSEKIFKRNGKDVLSRVRSAQENADVNAWLLAKGDFDEGLVRIPR